MKITNTNLFLSAHPFWFMGLSFFLCCSVCVSAQTVPTITFPDIPVKGYGDTTFVLNASSSSPITYVSSNTAVATISGNVVTIKAIGFSIISAYATGATPVPQLLVVCPKATLTVTADNKTITVGDANPTLTYTTTGFKNNQNTSVISGIPNFQTLASNPVVGVYPIVINSNTMTATNYEFMMVDGIMTVDKSLATPILNSEVAEIKFFPNPASDFISIVNADKEVISVIDMTGKTVLQTISNSDYLKIDVSRLPAGIYLLKAYKDSIIQNLKFIIKR